MPPTRSSQRGAIRANIPGYLTAEWSSQLRLLAQTRRHPYAKLVFGLELVAVGGLDLDAGEDGCGLGEGVSRMANALISVLEKACV